MDKLVLTVKETAGVLGVSDDLVYELAAQGVLPCLHLGRRRVIPRRAVDLLIERCVGDFDAAPTSVTRAARAATACFFVPRTDRLT